MKRFENILYVADPSGVVLRAFHHAVGLAERNNARLTVILVMERIPPYLTRLTPYMLRQVRIREQKAALDRLSDWVADRVEIETKIVEGKPFLEVIREVLRNGRDLVVKSAEGDISASGRLFGTTDMHLLRKCPCPVWLVKSTRRTPIRRILAAVDFNDLGPPDQDTAEPLNRIILELAGSLAYLERSEFHVVHAWSAPAEEALKRGARTGLLAENVGTYLEEMRQLSDAWLKQLMDKAKNWIGHEIFDAIVVRLHLPKGEARAVIPSLADELDVDVIVMGTVGRTGIPGLIIGNTAESILNQIDCSVLAVKPPGFITPVTLEE